MAVLHDFECSKGHIFEAMVEPQNKTLRCRFKGCRSLAERVFLPPHVSRMARGFEPSLIYRNAKGELWVPGRGDETKLPPRAKRLLAKRGFKKIEITNFREYERFCREQSQINKNRDDNIIQREQEQYDKALAQGIEELRRGGVIEVPNEDGTSRRINVPKLEDMHPQVRALAEYAIEQAKNSRFGGLQDGNQQGPHIAAFEYDRETYRDRETDWKARS